LDVDKLNRHRLDKPKRSMWRILADAGIVLIVVMGIALLAIALGVAFGTRMIG
jgi:hypothetical protein